MDSKHLEILRKEFTDTEEWIKHWLCLFFKNTSTHKTVFYGNSSFVDIGDMLREADGLFLTECAIFDTDISSQLQGGMEYRNITFHVCYRAADSLDGESVERAKQNCLEAVNEFRKFLISAKKCANKNVKTLEEVAPAVSGAPFLEGWHTIQVSLRYYKPFCEVPNWNLY